MEEPVGTLLLLGSERVCWWFDGPVVVVEEPVVFNRDATPSDCTFPLPSLFDLFHDVDSSNSGDDKREDHCDLIVMLIELQVVIWTSMRIEVMSQMRLYYVDCELNWECDTDILQCLFVRSL